MRLVNIVGARPQFIKIAPLSRVIAQHNETGSEPFIEEIIVHTGQHYDAGMSDVFFRELVLPEATFNLGVGSGSHGSQTGQMLAKIETVLLETKPDLVVVYGDTNSTLAGALAAAKLHIPVAHVEAGLRSFNRQMPEEINRVAADHICDLLLAPTFTAMHHLESEGLKEKAVLTGDIMYDAVLFNRELADRRHPNALTRFELEANSYGLVTIHRAENTDDGERLNNLLLAINEIAARHLRLVFPVHPRTAARLSSLSPPWTPHPGCCLVDPVGYFDMLNLVANACVVLTDSGGLQKEAFFLDTPCVTLREETEWPETVEGGGNVLAGHSTRDIVAAAADWKQRQGGGDVAFSSQKSKAFGDRSAALQILKVLLK